MEVILKYTHLKNYLIMVIILIRNFWRNLSVNMRIGPEQILEEVIKTRMLSLKLAEKYKIKILLKWMIKQL